ncbi:cadherin domain-containing protein, partial [Halomonas campaniensis]
APVFSTANKVSVAENTTAVTTLLATDADSDTLTYSITGGADQALFNLDTKSGALTFISAPDFEAPADSNGKNAYSVEVTANDGHGGNTPLTLTVTVTDVNEAPVLSGSTKVSVPENSTGTIYTVLASDPENNTLFYSLSGTDAALFNLDANSGALSFKHAPDFDAPADAGGNNVYDVILTANDGSLSSNPQALSITVTDVDDGNEAPVFTTSNKASVAENTTAVTTLVATDADGDVLTYSLTGGADQALFTLDANSGALSFKSAPNFEAPADSNSDNTYTVEVTASDGQGGSTPLTLEVTVTDVNEAPMLTGATKVSVAENTAGTLY